MTTKKKDSSGDLEIKTDPIQDALRQEQPASDMWQRLADLGDGFSRAALRDRREDLENMGLILRVLSGDPKFREDAYSSLRSYLSSKYGVRLLTRTREGLLLLETVELGIAGGGHPDTVARLILSDLPLCPRVYTHLKDAPEPEDLRRGEGDEVQAARERVSKAIASRLADPDAAKPAKVLNAALRALGGDEDYVRHMFQV